MTLAFNLTWVQLDLLPHSRSTGHAGLTGKRRVSVTPLEGFQEPLSLCFSPNLLTLEAAV